MRSPDAIYSTPYPAVSSSYKIVTNPGCTSTLLPTSTPTLGGGYSTSWVTSSMNSGLVGLPPPPARPPRCGLLEPSTATVTDLGYPPARAGYPMGTTVMERSYTVAPPVASDYSPARGYYEEDHYPSAYPPASYVYEDRRRGYPDEYYYPEDYSYYDYPDEYDRRDSRGRYDTDEEDDDGRQSPARDRRTLSPTREGSSSGSKRRDKQSDSEFRLEGKPRSSSPRASKLPPKMESSPMSAMKSEAACTSVSTAAKRSQIWAKYSARPKKQYPTSKPILPDPTPIEGMTSPVRRTVVTTVESTNSLMGAWGSKTKRKVMTVADPNQGEVILGGRDRKSVV